MTHPADAQPVNAIPRPKMDREIQLWICGFLFVFGAILFWLVPVVPLMRHLDSQDWTETPCKILSSEVEEGLHDDCDVAISFAYDWNDMSLTSGTYDVYGAGGGNMAVTVAREIVGRYPAGSKALCFVNPDDPSEALIDRSIDSIIFVVALIPLAFVVFGICGFVAALRGKRYSLPTAFDHAPPRS